MIPADDAGRAEVEQWIAKLDGVSLRDLSYGSEKLSRIGAMVNRRRRRNLRRRERKHPEMAEIYRRKIGDIEGFTVSAADAAHVEKIRGRVRVILDVMEQSLGRQPWLVYGLLATADGSSLISRLAGPPQTGNCVNRTAFF